MVIQWLGLCFHCLGHGFSPWWGTVILQAGQCGHKLKGKKSNSFKNNLVHIMDNNFYQNNKN